MRQARVRLAAAAVASSMMVWWLSLYDRPMPLVRLVWMCSIGLVLAAAIYTLAILFALSVVGLPVGIALFVVGTRVLTLRV